VGARGGHRGALRDIKAKLKDPFRRLKKTKNNEKNCPKIKTDILYIA
jgi:hypothetical protein